MQPRSLVPRGSRYESLAGPPSANEYLLLSVDMFSKYVVAVALPTEASRPV